MDIKKLTDSELESLYNEIYKERTVRAQTHEMFVKKNLNINGITSKDFEVTYADYNANPGDEDFKPTFSFSIKYGKKSYCIYYDFNEERPKKWWPYKKVTEYGRNVNKNLANEFIPIGFSESCENSYEFEGTTEQAIECLKAHGFIDIIDEQDKI